jgi:hypothetical protein
MTKLKFALGYLADTVTNVTNKMPRDTEKVIGVALVVAAIWLFGMVVTGVLPIPL